MAQFRGTVQGSRGAASRLAGKNGLLVTNCNGWDAGVRVVVEHINGKDVFRIYGTNGSGHGDSYGLIGTLVGTTFVPAKVIA